MLSFFKHLYTSLPPEVKGLSNGIAWTTIGSILSRIIPFVAWIAVAQILGKDAFGEYGIIRNTVMMFASFAGFGLGLTGTKFVAEYASSDNERASSIASLTLCFGAITGLLTCVSVVLSAQFLTHTTLQAPWLKNDMQVAAIILLFSAYNGAQTGVLNGLKKFKQLAIVTIVNSIVSFPIYIAAAYGGVFMCICAYAFCNLCMCLHSAYYLRQAENNGEITIKYMNGWKEWRLLFSYSLPSALAGICVMPVKWGVEVILVRNCSFSAMGVFAAAFTIHTIILTFAATLSNPFITYMASSKSNSDMINRLNLIIPWFLGLVTCLPFLWFPEIGEMMFGTEFAGGDFKLTFAIVVFFTLVLMYKQGLARIFIVRNMQWIGFSSNIVWSLILLILFTLFFDKNSVGLAFSYLGAYILVTLVFYPIYLVNKWIPRSFVFSWEAFSIWLISIIPMFFVTSILDYTTKFVCCSVSLIISLGLLKFLLKKKDITHD